MSDTEIRMMRYTIEQLSAELQATRQYVSDIEPKLERTRKALDVAVDALDAGRTLARIAGFEMLAAGMDEAIDKITTLKPKDNGGNK